MTIAHGGTKIPICGCDAVGVGRHAGIAGDALKLLSRLHALRLHVAIAVLRHLPIPGRWKQTLVWLLSPRRVVGALAIVRDDEGRLLLLRSTWLRRWQLPGGTVEHHETPVEALRRELLEETGREIASIAQPTVLTEGSLPQILFLYTVTLRPGRFRLSAEHTAWAFHRMDALPAEVRWLVRTVVPDIDAAEPRA